ncbi:MAG TPA: hypothetical protein VN915_07700 [Elusimicrobiota bacterium]|nr:hypothetical protein [Elusimicrobiota bacterium]
MGRAAFAVCLLLAAAAPSWGAPGKDLHRRARLLLRDIRVESSAPQKDVERLRAQLSELQAENHAAPDDQVTAELQAAEANLKLVEAGSPLPPPLPEEAVSDDDLRDSVAQPLPAARRPVFPPAAPAAAADAAAPLFDGSVRRAGLTSPAVEAPPDEPDADLGRYLELNETVPQQSFLIKASASLLAKLHEKDDGGQRAQYMGVILHERISKHPKRGSFIALRVVARKDKKLHLIYRARDGGAVDEDLGWLDQWTRIPKAPRTGKIRPRPKRGAKGGGGGDDGDGDGDGGGSGKKGHGGHKKGRGGGGGGAGGGGDGDGGGGTGAGPGGSGPSHHAKAPKINGGGSMFDGGGGDGGDGNFAGGASGGLFSGKGPRGHGRKSRHGGAAAGDSSETASASGDSDPAGAFGAGRAHAGAGGSLSADEPGSGSRKRKNARVPLPKDFTTRGGGSRLPGGGAEGGSGPGGAGLGGFQMSPLGMKDFHKNDLPAPTGAPRASAAPGELAQAKPSPAASASAAPAAAPLTSPVGADEQLRDAVAAHSAPSPLPAASVVPRASLSPIAPAAPEPEGSSPLLAACACAAAIGLGAYAFRRLRRPRSLNS